jgi:hypothetical protein
MFEVLSQKYGPELSINRPPPWTVILGIEEVELRVLSGIATGRNVRIADILDPNMRPGCLGFRYFFYLSPWWINLTKITINEDQLGVSNSRPVLFRGLATESDMCSVLNGNHSPRQE